MTIHAVNWNVLEDENTLNFWNQNWMQLWTDEEIPISDDVLSWSKMTVAQKEVFKRVLAGLTALDTLQGNVGMPYLGLHMEDLRKKAVFSFMGTMEQMHAKSYSTIFTTLAKQSDIDYLFNEWIPTNKYLQTKGEIIESYYKGIKTKKDLYMALVASVFLESYLFFSGFYYPLLLSGQGILTNSGEIIKLILMDESIHGLYTGFQAQEVFETLSKRDQKRVEADVYELLEELYQNEVSYTDELYAPLGIQEDVKKFIRYNANKALMQLGYETYFPEEDVNPIVMNGISTSTVNHDFFSQKGNGYIFKVNIEPITKEDFKFNFEEDEWVAEYKKLGYY